MFGDSGTFWVSWLYIRDSAFSSWSCMKPPPGRSFSTASISTLISSASKVSREVMPTLPSMVSPKLNLSLPMLIETVAFGARNDLNSGNMLPSSMYTVSESRNIFCHANSYSLCVQRGLTQVPRGPF